MTAELMVLGGERTAATEGTASDVIEPSTGRPPKRLPIPAISSMRPRFLDSES